MLCCAVLRPHLVMSKLKTKLDNLHRGISRSRSTIYQIFYMYYALTVQFNSNIKFKSQH